MHVGIGMMVASSMEQKWSDGIPALWEKCAATVVRTFLKHVCLDSIILQCGGGPAAKELVECAWDTRHNKTLARITPARSSPSNGDVESGIAQPG